MLSPTMLPLLVSALSALAGLSAAKSPWSVQDTQPHVRAQVPTIDLKTRDTSLDSWIEYETQVAFNGILANVGGKSSQGFLGNVLPGTCIASPSTSSPDYFYIWVRDGAISLHTVFSQLANQNLNNDTLAQILTDYINSSDELQRTTNPSGSFTSGGLGEPKFNADGSAFTGSWGRPQRDGPALRALGLIDYVNTMITDKAASASDLQSVVENVIIPDLNYVAQNWNESGFDLWEEVDGFHFFTATAQYLALSNAQLLQNNFNGEFSTYKEQATQLADFLESFYSSSKNYIVETPANTQRSGLDAAVPLAMLLSRWIPSATSETETSPDSAALSEFAFDSPKLVSTLCALIDSMASLYPINQGINAQTSGVAIGRYPEDVYDGVSTSQGNPWFLCTAAIAHNLYLLAETLVKKPSSYVLNISSESGGCMYTRFIDGNTLVPRSDPRYMDLVNDISAYADSFLNIIQQHRSFDDGSMSEEFSRYNGYMTGAEKLTWSYSAFFDAVSARSQLQKLL